MNSLLNLAELGSRLSKVDMLLLALLKRRMDLALQVGAYKINEKTKEKQSIFRPEIEDKRLAAFREWATEHRMNPHFAEALFYLIIGESCKQQMIQLQNSAGKALVEPLTEEAEYEILKKNLLLLTEQWSQSYDEDYDRAFFATHAYLDFESDLIRQEIAKLSEARTALDLGCATGILTLGLAGRFGKVIGYDISPHMIEKARAKKQSAKFSDVAFEVADIENGIPQTDGSISFVVMSLGTASDMRNIQPVLQEVKRVLKPGGRFLCSFYNRNALLYHWDFIPWPVGLAAEINPHKHCLDVHYGDDVLSVYAKPYTVEEVRSIFDGLLEVSSVLTYPTISSILPSDLLEKQPEVQTAVDTIDRKLSESGTGAYILVTGQKCA